MDYIFREQDLSLYRTMAEHLAEACLLAAVMIVLVEGPTRYLAAREDENFVERISNDFRKQANDISSNVWNGIFRKLVPDSIGSEIEKVLKSDICRIRPSYVITISDGNDIGIKEDEIIVRRQLSYRLQNLTNEKLDYPLTFRIKSQSGDRSLAQADGSILVLPRIVEVGIAGKKHLPGADSRLQFKETVCLPADRSTTVEIYSDAEELLNIRERALYVMTAPTAGIDVLIVNNSKKVYVPAGNVYLTSGPDRLVASMEGRWSYDGGLLSGTALSIAWEPRPVEHALPLD